MSAMTLRTYTLSDHEAQMIFDCLDTAARIPTLSDETLIAVLALRDRFKPEDPR